MDDAGAASAVSEPGSDALAAARAALARHDWTAALEAARSRRFEEGSILEADRADIEADAAWWLGQLDECIAARELAYRTYEEHGHQRRAGQAAVWLWEHHAISARPSIASGWLRRARRALEDDPTCVEHGNLLLREAEMAHGSGQLDDAVAIADRALALGRDLRSPDLEAEALQAKGRVLIDRGQLDEGMGHLDEAMLFAVEGRLGPFSTGKVYCSLIAACEEVDDFDRAAEWTEATSRWAQQHPFAIFPGICRVHRAIVLKRQGSLIEAEREAVRACDELRSSHRAAGAAAFAEVGDIRRRLGDLEEAEHAFARAQEIRGGPCGGLALLRLAQGHVDAALEIVTTCVAGATNRLARAGLLPMLVHVAVAAGDLDAAATALAEVEAIATDFGTPSLRATAASTRGRLLLAQRHADAPGVLRAAADGWQALEVPYEEATARTLLGQALRVVGDEAGAVAAFARATELFDQIGAHVDARLVEGGGKAPRPAGLTDREVEVLRLIAEGLTNSEIASRLFLSVKTVSRHLSNIFTKVGVTSRAGATAFAFEHHLVEPRR